MIKALSRIVPMIAAALLPPGCVTAPIAQAPTASSAQNIFWTALTSHCGNAYAGALTSNDAADAEMQGAEMVMHVRRCDAARIEVPFHIREPDGSWNRSRTWVLTRTDTGIRLKHDHRHEDGEPDAVTLYGGDTADGGTPRRQSFPVDEESIAMFQREGLDASVTNIWSIAVDPAGTRGADFTYALSRTIAAGAPQDRDFTVRFDLTRPIAPPPAPWGF